MFINDIFNKKLNESLRDGEYYTFRVFFDDGTDETLNFSSDDIDWDKVGAKRGKRVVDVDRQGGIQGSQSDAPRKPHDFPDDRGLARSQRAHDRQLPEGGFDIPEIPRAPTPKPPKEKDIAEAHGPYGQKKASDLEKIQKAKDREKKNAPGQLRRALPPSKQHYRDSSIEYFAKLDEQDIDTEQDSERSPYPPEKDFPNWYDMRDRKFEVHRNDGTIDFIQPGTDEWNEIYDREFPDHPRPDNLRDVYSDGNPVAEAGPFSYGAKKPKKGSVADLAAQKRKEQERGKQPVEPRDQRVGVARVVKDVAEGISVVDQDYDLDQMHLTLDIEGKKVSFTYWDYEEDFSNAERRDVFDQLQEQPWYKGLDHPTKMEILDAAYRAIRGLEPQEYRPTVRDEPLDEQGVAEGSLNEFAPSGGGGGRWYSDDQLYEIIGEDWLEAFDVSGDQGNIDLRGERARLFLAQEAEAWLTDRGYRVNVLDVRDDGDELSWYIQGALYRGLDEDWKKVNRRDRTPGMSRKAVKAYRRENPGSKLQTAVTTKPSKLKKGSKSAKRRKSFCARMSGMKRAHAGAKTKRDPDSPINKALRRWNCESIEDMRNLIEYAEQVIMEEKKLSDQEKQSLRQTVKNVDYTKPSTDTKAQLSPNAKKELRQTVKDYEHPKPTNEASAREKLDRRFQDLRKKRGAPDPEYYKEFGKSYDIEDDQKRYAHQAELKKKYGVNEAKQVTSSWEVTFKDGKTKAMKAAHDQGSGPSNSQILAIATLNNPTKQVVSVKQLNTPNAKTTKISSRSKNGFQWRDRDDSGKIGINESDASEKYLEELARAGYDVVTEAATLCPECGGAAYSDHMLAEKQDACYHKVKSRYKVWPSAYASGALVKCRKKGAANWGNKSKK